MRVWIAFLAGGLFGTGLHLSGMTDTQKVIGFLDVFGAWDPTLLFVMGGAMIPMAIAWAVARGRTPLAGGQFPTRPDPRLGRRLVTGALMFGAGWGLVGLCPGTALASLSYGGVAGFAFLMAMAGGMLLAPSAVRLLDRGQSAQ